MALLGRLVTWIIVSSVALIEFDLLAIVSQRSGSDVVVAPVSSATVAESALVAESVPDATAGRKRKYFTTYVDGKRHRCQGGQFLLRVRSGILPLGSLVPMLKLR